MGKSTLYNLLLGKERSIVSDIPGTTRDALPCSLDTSFGYYQLIDTPGLVARSKIKERVNFYASLRTEESLQGADIVLLVVDPTQGITRQDKRIAQRIKEGEKGCLVFINKMDLVLDHYSQWQTEKLIEEIRQDLGFLNYASFLSWIRSFPLYLSGCFSHSGWNCYSLLSENKTSFLNESLRPKINQKTGR